MNEYQMNIDGDRNLKKTFFCNILLLLATFSPLSSEKIYIL